MKRFKIMTRDERLKQRAVMNLAKELMDDIKAICVMDDEVKLCSKCFIAEKKIDTLFLLVSYQIKTRRKI